MDRHNIVGSEAGRILTPGHGSIRGFRARRRLNLLLPTAVVAVGLAAIVAVLTVAHP